MPFGSTRNEFSSLLVLGCGLLALMVCGPGCPASTSGTGTDTEPSTESLTTASDSGATTSPDPTSVGSSGGSGTTTAVADSSGPASSTGGCGDCDNGDVCDGVETCVDGECVAGEPLECDDGVSCTEDSCDAELGCVHTPSDTLCECGETCDSVLGCGDYCVPTTCNGQTYDCGNCLDDDGDCQVDSADANCWGPCDNNEEGWSGEVPGQQNQSTCVAMDCYFDSNSGAGNDECYWSHSCDTLEPAGCTYDAETTIPGSGQTCSELADAQTEQCESFCGAITPNGCDCFGCCNVTLDDKSTVSVFLGSEDVDGNGTCNVDTAADPELCQPCTQVPSCFNDCGECEICIGETELPPGCEEQECPEDAQPCGQPGQDPCPVAHACITGCCVPQPG